jgi:hypothetical protein
MSGHGLLDERAPHALGEPLGRVISHLGESSRSAAALQA